MDGEAAIAAFGPNATILDVRRRLRCTSCGEPGRLNQIDARPSMRDVYAEMREAGILVGAPRYQS